MTSRRDFLRHSALVASAAVTVPAWARAVAGSGVERIAIGETFVAPAWLAAMADLAEGGNSADRAFWRTFSSLPPIAVNAGANELHVVTLPAPGVEAFDALQARRVSMQANEQLAQQVRESEGRIAGLATLAAVDPLAVREAERAITRLGLSGLSLGANRGLRLDHPRLWPVYEFAAAARVPVYLPAAYTAAVGESPYRTMGAAGVIMGAAADAGRHMNQLIFGGVLDAFPDLMVVLARAGEGTPYWYGRIQDTYVAIQESGGALPSRAAHEYFNDNILLTSTDMSLQTLRFCETMLGNGRILASHEHAQQALAVLATRSGMNLHQLTQVETGHWLREV